MNPQLVQVFWAPGKGWGIRCLEDLLPGTFVCEYAGEILTTDELEERNRAQADLGKHFPVELNACPVTEDYVEDDTGLCLDATNLGNVARWGSLRFALSLDGVLFERVAIRSSPPSKGVCFLAYSPETSFRMSFFGPGLNWTKVCQLT